jgi:hypothetical protein
MYPGMSCLGSKAPLKGPTADSPSGGGAQFANKASVCVLANTAVRSATMARRVQVLHVLSCILVGGHTVLEFMYKALEYLLVCMRARQFTAIDVAQTAHIIGTWRGGPERRGSKRPAVMELVNEIERASIELMQIGEMTSRQLANVLWMFGRLQQQPSQFLFSQLASRMLSERVRALTMLCAVIGACWHAAHAHLQTQWA